MVREALVSSAIAVAMATLCLSSAVASQEAETGRAGILPHCPKAGLCPYVKRIIPDFIYHAPAHAQSPAAVPHYPPLHHLFPLPVVAYPSAAAHPAHPPSIVVHTTNPHHAAPPAPGHGDAHHVTRRDAPPAHPHKPLHASLCGNLCVNDDVCPGQKKCCPTECGYSCFDPVHIAE